MSIKRWLVSVVAASLVLSGLMAAPAAAEASGGQFRCFGTFSQWGGSGTAECTGPATGVYREGATTVICSSVCDFVMQIDYSTTCVGSEPPLLTTWSGDITISGNGGTVGTPFSGAAAGAGVAFTTSSPVGVGDGVFAWVTPIGACGAPLLTNFNMVGTLAFD